MSTKRKVPSHYCRKLKPNKTYSLCK
uniref:Uncharacterized protein n=1 Tax=Rhizophora mucronata TaxID=61149 RepID=A0A2P2QLH3_RHIMU